MDEYQELYKHYTHLFQTYKLEVDRCNHRYLQLQQFQQPPEVLERFKNDGKVYLGRIKAKLHAIKEELNIRKFHIEQLKEKRNLQSEHENDPGNRIYQQIEATQFQSMPNQYINPNIRRVQQTRNPPPVRIPNKIDSQNELRNLQAKLSQIDPVTPFYSFQDAINRLSPFTFETTTADLKLWDQRVDHYSYNLIQTTTELNEKISDCLQNHEKQQNDAFQVCFLTLEEEWNQEQMLLNQEELRRRQQEIESSQILDILQIKVPSDTESLNDDITNFFA